MMGTARTSHRRDKDKHILNVVKKPEKKKPQV
jgi:hypothetical protein